MSDNAGSKDETVHSDLKAGHAPAMKVGGMRVAAPRRTSRSDDNNAAPAADQDNAAQDNTEGDQTAATEDQETTGAVTRQQAAGQMVAGKFVKIQDAFPTEAVRQIHEKHFDNVPKHEPHTRTNHHEAKFVIQPRKM